MIIVKISRIIKLLLRNVRGKNLVPYFHSVDLYECRLVTVSELYTR